MKKMYMLICIIIIILLLNPLCSYSDDNISWICRNFPPVFIEDGPDAKKGYGDFVVQLLINNLEGYKHDFIKCNMKRSLILLKNQEKVSHPAILKRSDRENYIEFSIPAYVLLPNGVIILKNNLNKFSPYMNDKEQFLLENAITQSELKLGILIGRAYGGIIDKILTKYKNHRNISVIHNEENVHLHKMLKAKRIDYTIGYPIEGQYFAKIIKSSENLLCLPVDGMPEYYKGYIGFPKNDWGKKNIKKINSIIEKNRNTTEYHAAYEYWLDENSIMRYRNYVKEVYGNF